MSKSLSVIKNIVFSVNIAANKLIKVFFYTVSVCTTSSICPIYIPKIDILIQSVSFNKVSS